MKTKWWEYLDYPGYALFMIALFMMHRNLKIAAICGALGFVTTATFFFMQQKNLHNDR